MSDASIRAGAELRGCDPVWLQLAPDPILAFLHVPEGTEQNRTGVLIFPPFGWEEMCSYRARRHWAAELAHAGFPTARITFPGAGDSGGKPTDPARFSTWSAAVASSAAWLRHATGATRIAAIGIGVGGFVLCHAVTEQAPIDDLVLWAVPARGRMLVREVRAQAGVIDAEHAHDRKGNRVLADGALEAVGFLLSAETIHTLEALDLTTLEFPDAANRRVLLLGRDQLGPDRRLRTHLERSGADVALGDGVDYNALIAHPQAAMTPWRTIDASISWLGSGQWGRSMQRPLKAPHVVLSGPVELRENGSWIRETPIEIEVGERRLFAVVCEPTDDHPAPICGVLLNAGALAHVGPNRAWVEAARRWAAKGVRSVRLDLEGIGESDGDERRYEVDAGLYSEHLIGQVVAALDDLAAREIGNRFVLGGLCSGAYWALHGALTDRRVEGALLINLFSFYWSEALVSERRTEVALHAVRGMGWERLMRGDVTSDQVRRVLASLRPRRLRERKAHPVETAQSALVDHALDTLRDRDTGVLILLSEAEPLYAQFERQGRLDRLDRWPNLTLERYPSRDHMFRAPSVQRSVADTLDRSVWRILERATTQR